MQKPIIFIHGMFVTGQSSVPWICGEPGRQEVVAAIGEWRRCCPCA